MRTRKKKNAPRGVSRGARVWVAEFRKHWGNGLESLAKAATVYADAIRDNPSYAEVFKRECRDVVPDSAWDRLLAVGEKQLHAKLLTGSINGSAKRADMIGRLSYGLQEKLLNHGMIDFVKPDGKICKIDATAATTSQLRQVCCGTSLRTAKEQRKYIAAQRAKDTAPPRWVVVRDGQDIKLWLRGSYTLAELRKAIQEAEHGG